MGAKKEKVNRESQRAAIGYIRVSTTRQDLDRQRWLILAYADQHELNVIEYIETKIGSRKTEAERGIDKLKEIARTGKVNVIIFSELSRLGRSISQIIRLVETFVNEYEVELHFIKENMILRKGERDIQTKIMLTMFSLFAEIESDLIRERTRDALAARRKAGVKLGRPKLKSKLDNKEEEIKGMVTMGVKQKFIAKKMDCTEATLSNWLKRKRKEWMVVNGKEKEKAK